MAQRNLKFALASIAIGLLLVWTMTLSAEDGLTFTSADGRVAFWAPVKPRSSVDALPSQTGAPYRRTTFAVEGDRYLLLAGILDFREDLATTGDEDSYLDTMLESMRAGFGAQFKLDETRGISTLRLAKSNLKGREIRGQLQGQQMILRAYVGAHSIYMQQVGYPIGDATASKMSDRFLNSLTIEVK